MPPSYRDIFNADLAGSFGHYFDTMAFGELTVRGEVVSQRYESVAESFVYQSSKATEPGDFGRFCLEILTHADEDVDFSRFDNDGADGVPNSGDDDGFVDAVFINMPSVPENFLLGPATGIAILGFDEAFITKDLGAGGAPIRIAPDQGVIHQGGTADVQAL